MDETWRSAWAAALDELELTLETTERLLAGELPDEVDVPAWAPPRIPGPLPQDLLERAQALLGRQRLLIGETVATMTGARRRLDLLEKLTGLRVAGTGNRPVYVDLTA